MIFDVTISDGTTSVSVSLTYRRWIPGRDPWVFRGGSALAGVSATDWQIVKAVGRLTMFADFSGNTERPLFQLDGFGNLSRDPAVGDTGEGMYFGPSAQMDDFVEWELTRIR